MKYVIILGDGMADRPLEELNGQTPLEYANTPMMDALSEMGEVEQLVRVRVGLIVEHISRLTVNRHIVETVKGEGLGIVDSHIVIGPKHSAKILYGGT